MLQHSNTEAIKPQRVLVLGAGGFVGGATVQNLQAKGIETVALTREQLDLLKPNAAHTLAELIKPNDALVILATIAPAKNSEQMIANLQMLQPVCEVIKEKAALLTQIVYISSDAVYADDVSLCSENAILQPSSFHGMMHMARELMLKAVAGNIPLAILRPSILYGLQDPHNSYGPNRFLRLAQQGKSLSLFGNGEEKRDHIYINDVAEIIALALLHKSRGVLNIATGDSPSFREVAEMIVQLCESAVAIEPTVRQNAITHRHFDITASRVAFPNFKYTSLATGLRQVQQQYQASKEYA